VGRIQAQVESLPMSACLCSQGATPKQAEELVSGYKRLTDTGPGGMGGSYLALAVTSKGVGAPVGFEQSPSGPAAESR
jgi:hypothetical protein